MPVALPFAALLGLVVGSFLNVVVWRLPRGESLNHPGSHCPKCEAPVKPYDNIPVLSWLLLRGRCRSCSTRISARYPAIEALTGILWVAVLARFWDEPAQAALGIVLVTALVTIAFIDLDTQTIPNRIIYPTAAVGLGLLIALDLDALPEHLIAAAGAFAFFFVPWYLTKGKGMGFGDVRLAAVLGLYLGRGVMPAVMIGLVVGVLVGGMVLRRLGLAEGRKTKVPFGPSLAFGGVVAVFVGADLADVYLDTF